MTANWIVIIVGIAVSFLGWYLTPHAWGYGLFGFGLAHIILGIIDMFRFASDEEPQS
ncbi:hypothetical protein ACHHV8_11735 [Paenibacillus sp. TAB 01]|uniref:hypothetical protein n=1 Tax=Paenibacillus sp. TAB 01 TaxID=3368988 RepID=UPI00375033A4